MNHKEPTRRAIVSIPSSYVLDLLTGQTFPTLMNQLPKDVRLIGVWHDHRRNAFDLVVEHESFNPNVEGCELVRLDLSFATRSSIVAGIAERLFTEMAMSPLRPSELNGETLAPMIDRAIGGRR